MDEQQNIPARFCFILFCCLFLTSASVAPAGQVQRPQVSINHSTWEQLVEALGGDLPVEPEDWPRRLKGTGTRFFASVFPKGRSLERRFTSFMQPRTVLAIDLERGANIALVAYVPRIKQFQMMLATPARTDFEFQTLTREHGRWNREVVPRTLCTGCHQSGLGIFSVGPWSETQLSREVGGQLEKMIRQGESQDALSQTLLNEFRENLDPEFLENRVLQANTSVLQARACRKSCAENFECHGILRKAQKLDPDGWWITSPSSTQHRELIGELARLYDGPLRSVKETVLSHHAPEIGDPLAPQSIYEIDPLTPRKRRYFQQQPRGSGSDVAQMVLANVHRCQNLKGAAEFEAELEDAMSEPQVALSERSLQASRLTSQALLVRHCAGCHSGKAVAGVVMPELPFDDIEKLKAYRGSFGRTCYELVRNGAMPPEGKLSPEDRLELLKVLEPIQK